MLFLLALYSQKVVFTANAFKDIAIRVCPPSAANVHDRTRGPARSCDRSIAPDNTGDHRNARAQA
jgi:hypothetical protein